MIRNDLQATFIKTHKAIACDIFNNSISLNKKIVDLENAINDRHPVISREVMSHTSLNQSDHNRY